MMKRSSEVHVGPGRPSASEAAVSPRPGRALRTLASRFLAAASRLLAVLCLLGLAVKFLGELVSDRFWWSQWLEWTPNALVVAGSLLTLLPASVCAWLAHRLARLPRRTAALLGAAWVAFITHGVYTIVVDAPFYRARPGGPGSLDDSARVLFWNAAAGEREGWEDAAAGADPTLAILVGLNDRGPVASLLARMPEGSVRLVYDRFTVLSSLPMKRFGFTHLNIPPGVGYDPRLPEGRTSRHDPGAAMYLETAARRDGEGSMVTWIIDLPSDISLGRESIAREARSAIDSFDGQRMIRGRDGHWTIEPGTGHAGPKGFPAPDLIIGDFNIPRGADSLSHLRRGYPDAFEQAATGYGASWPRKWPLWHLDQAFIGPNLRAWRYELRDAGSGSHLMQVVDVTAR